jgi:hypothetical protein
MTGNIGSGSPQRIENSRTRTETCRYLAHDSVSEDKDSLFERKKVRNLTEAERLDVRKEIARIAGVSVGNNQGQAADDDRAFGHHQSVTGKRTFHPSSLVVEQAIARRAAGEAVAESEQKRYC